MLHAANVGGKIHYERCYYRKIITIFFFLKKRETWKKGLYYQDFDFFFSNSAFYVMKLLCYEVIKL